MGIPCRSTGPASSAFPLVEGLLGLGAFAERELGTDPELRGALQGLLDRRIERFRRAESGARSAADAERKVAPFFRAVPLQGGAGLGTLVVSPDGARLANRGPDETNVHDTSNGRVLGTFRSSADFVYFTPRGRLLTLSIMSQKVEYFSRKLRLWPHQASYQVLPAFLDNGTVALMVGSARGTINVLRAPRGQLLQQVETGRSLRGIHPSPDGTRIALESDDTVRPGLLLWDRTAGSPAVVTAPVEGRGIPWGSQWTPDGRYLLTRWYDAGERALVLHDGKTLEPVHEWNIDPVSQRFAFCADNRRIAVVVRDGRLQVLDLVDKSGQVIAQGFSGSAIPGFEGDDLAWVADDGGLRFWSLSTGNEALFLTFAPGARLLPGGKRAGFLLAGPTDRLLVPDLPAMANAVRHGEIGVFP